VIKFWNRFLYYDYILYIIYYDDPKDLIIWYLQSSNSTKRYEKKNIQYSLRNKFSICVRNTIKTVFYLNHHQLYLIATTKKLDLTFIMRLNELIQINYFFRRITNYVTQLWRRSPNENKPEEKSRTIIRAKKVIHFFFNFSCLFWWS
jgi:hypothetical protein